LESTGPAFIVTWTEGQEQAEGIASVASRSSAHLHEFIFTDPFVYGMLLSACLGTYVAPASSDLGAAFGGYGDGACLFATSANVG